VKVLFNRNSLTEVSRIKYLNKKLKPKRGVASDGIFTHIYKACGELFVELLTYVFNTVLETSEYPSSWTISKVIPVPKSKAVQYVSNYATQHIKNQWNENM
jgi:hypothetical protein